MTNTILLLLGFSLMGVLGTAQAVPIHKWVDKNGIVNYSNLPPAGKRTTILEYKGLGNTSAITKRERESARDNTPTEKLDPNLQKKINAEKEIAKQNCIKSRESVAMLESGIRISRVNEKGERENLDDKGRAEELIRAKRAVQDWCTE